MQHKKYTHRPGCLHTELCVYFLCYTAPMATVLDVQSTSRTEHGL